MTQNHEKDKGNGLTPEEVKQFYDKFGKKQDYQFYENAAIRELVHHSDFANAFSVFEFGCGTGRLAAELFINEFNDQCKYYGVDVSNTMVSLSRKRLDQWSGRVKIDLIGENIELNVGDGTYDRFITTYVLDLLSEEDIRKVLFQAHRILKSDGLLCLASLTWGQSGFCKLVSRAWYRIFKLRPKWVGGCRPINAASFLDNKDWKILHHNVISSLGISSEIIVAKPKKLL